MEIIVLRHIAGGDAQTLRSLAARTGKSIGALDQAMRKLTLRGIIRRVLVNGTPRYTLTSADAIARWAQAHTQETLALLRRKEDDICQFFTALQTQADQPRIEHFDGMEGMVQAYGDLLAGDEKDIVAFLLVHKKEEEDALADCKKQFAHEVRRRGITLRVLAHNTPLGRRYQSRDHLAYRSTRLVSTGDYPFLCTQYVSGNTVTFLDEAAQKGYRMHCPRFAVSQRAFFQAIWEAHVPGKRRAPCQPLLVDVSMVALSELERCGGASYAACRERREKPTI